MRTLAIRGEGAPLQMSLEEIGGGKVMWPFKMNGEFVKRGTFLTAEQILSINPANRASLLGRFIRVWPKAAEGQGKASPTPAARADQAERPRGRSHTRHVVSLGFDRYSVYEGELLNDKPLKRADAYALAGIKDPKRGDKEH